MYRASRSIPFMLVLEEQQIDALTNSPLGGEPVILRRSITGKAAGSINASQAQTPPSEAHRMNGWNLRFMAKIEDTTSGHVRPVANGNQDFRVSTGTIKPLGNIPFKAESYYYSQAAVPSDPTAQITVSVPAGPIPRGVQPGKR